MSEREDAETRFRVRDYTATPMGQEAELLVAQSPRVQVRCPAYLAGMVSACTRFDSLRGHAVALSRAFGLDRRAAEEMHAELARLAEAGLLVSLDALRASADVARPTLPSIDAITVVTRDRPASLQTSLRTLVGPLAAVGGCGDVVVADDSRDPAHAAANRRAAAALAEAQPSRAIHYCGPEERRRLAAALAAASGVAPEVVTFALCGSPDIDVATGANRNLCLLLTGGRMCLNVDDDVRCGDATARPAPGLVCTSGDPTRFACFADGPRAMAASPAPTPELLLDCHARLLGQPLTGCIGALASEDARLDLDGMRPSFFERLRAGNAAVRATVTGLAGDSGMGRPLYFLMADAATCPGVQASELEYDWARATRAVVRAAPTWCVAEPTLLQTAAFGLDNRTPTVPFMPAFRNQDGVFAVTLRACAPTACVGHIPLTLHHVPPEPRAFEADAIWREATVLRAADYLIRLTAGCAFGAGDCALERRLAVLGSHLRVLGELPVAALDDVLRMERLASLSETVSRLETRLHREELHAALAADVEQALDHVQEAAEADIMACPEDLAAGRLPAEGLAIFARCLRQYGSLLECWPTLAAAARDLSPA